MAELSFISGRHGKGNCQFFQNLRQLPYAPRVGQYKADYAEKVKLASAEKLPFRMQWFLPRVHFDAESRCLHRALALPGKLNNLALFGLNAPICSAEQIS